MLSCGKSQNSEGDFDGDDEGTLAAPALRIFASTQAVMSYDIYISSPITSPTHYDELSQLLRRADEDTEFNLYINTPGGDLLAGLALVQAIRDSKAVVRTILNPQAFSMGALLFLCGKERVAPPNSLLMFHHYSGGLFGKGNEQVAELTATNIWFETVMQDICYPFLSKKEIRDILQGKDLWLQHADIEKRLAKAIAAA